MECGKRHLKILEIFVQGMPALDKSLFLPPGLLQARSLKRTRVVPDFNIDVNLKMHEINEDISQGPITLHTIKLY